MTTQLYGETHQTKRQVLPYRFQLTPNGKVAITNLRSQTLYVTRTEVSNILKRDDLDAHRRKMYEAALAEFDKDDAKKKAVQ